MYGAYGSLWSMNETAEDIIFQVICSATISLESETRSDTRESYSSSMSEIISLTRNFSAVCTFYARILLNNSGIEQQLRIIIYVILQAGITDITYLPEDGRVLRWILQFKMILLAISRNVTCVRTFNFENEYLRLIRIRLPKNWVTYTHSRSKKRIVKISKNLSREWIYATDALTWTKAK